ncbi:MAG: SAM-dependent methyltransferase [Bacteroidia bacterium]|nr:SAM-dependent methyltransferase [Bacteroidia bacterium]
MKQGQLYLIPSPLGENTVEKVIPPIVREIALTLKFFIVENERTARRFLKTLDRSVNIDELHFTVFDEHSGLKGISEMLDPAVHGENIGLLSEAGCPAVADPGTELVRLAHKKNIRVIPLTGPSSIILALMASGLQGQNFAFNGYLPVKKNERITAIKKLEQKSLMDDQTQIFIETPYRNNHLVQDIVESCNPGTLLCIASELTTEQESVLTKPVAEWKISLPDLNKKAAIFLIKR